MTELNELIYAGVKLVNDKIGVPKESEKKDKTWMGNEAGKTNKKLQQQAKILRKRKHESNRKKKKLKLTADKSDDSTGRIKSKNIGERRKTQKVPGQNQTIQTK